MKTSLTFSPDTVISISAIFIALASIFISVWQAEEYRLHNRLSVRPKLEILGGPDGNKGLVYFVANSGLGPAILVEKKIFFKDREMRMSSEGGSGSVYYTIQDSLKLNNLLVEYDAVEPGLAISAGEKRIMVHFRQKKDNPVEFDLTEVLQNVHFQITYKSMYDEIFECGW